MLARVRTVDARKLGAVYSESQLVSGVLIFGTDAVLVEVKFAGVMEDRDAIICRLECNVKQLFDDKANRQKAVA